MDRAKHPALLLVDGVSSIASLDFRFDDWRVDCAITGSQKGFMLPAGLGILYMSETALARVEGCTMPRAYFDLKAMRANNAQGYFPSTPALSLLYGLDEALTMLLDEGMDNVAARHKRLATGVRAAVKAWGLRECAKRPEIASNSLTAIVVPEGVDARTVIDIAFNARPEPVQAKEITARQGVPQRYLEQVMQQLVRAGILKGVRGPRGGYRLARERRRISVGDVVRVAESIEDDEEKHSPRSDLGMRIVAPFVVTLQEELMTRLDSVSIEDLCQRARTAGVDAGIETSADFTI